MTIRILLASNEPVPTKGLEAVLVAGGFQVTAICRDVAELFESLHHSVPDIAILDTPVLPELDVIGELRRLAPQCQFVLWPRRIPPERVQEAARFGARGVLPANAPPESYLETLNLLAHFPCPEPGPAALVDLACSPFERQAIALAGCGLTNHEIARAMRSDGATVNKLLQNVSLRLGAQDRYELALYGLSTIKESYQYDGEPYLWKKETAIV